VKATRPSAAQRQRAAQAAVLARAEDEGAEQAEANENGEISYAIKIYFVLLSLETDHLYLSLQLWHLILGMHPRLESRRKSFLPCEEPFQTSVLHHQVCCLRILYCK
jgi:hypothetical protein